MPKLNRCCQHPEDNFCRPSSESNPCNCCLKPEPTEKYPKFVVTNTDDEGMPISIQALKFNADLKESDGRPRIVGRDKEDKNNLPMFYTTRRLSKRQPLVKAWASLLCTLDVNPSLSFSQAADLIDSFGHKTHVWCSMD